jgi:hypothetical protein
VSILKKRKLKIAVAARRSGHKFFAFSDCIFFPLSFLVSSRPADLTDSLKQARGPN